MFTKRLEEKLTAMLAAQGEIVDMLGQVLKQQKRTEELRERLDVALKNQRELGGVLTMLEGGQGKILDALKEGQGSILDALEQRPLEDKLQEGIENILGYDGPKGRGRT